MVLFLWYSFSGKNSGKPLVFLHREVKGFIHMSLKVGISGFGRIGRSTLRAMLSKGVFPAVISDVQPGAVLAKLFKADTNYGLWPEEVLFDAFAAPILGAIGRFIIGGRVIPYVQVDLKNPETKPDWSRFDADVVVDCTGIATKSRDYSLDHVARGAKKVLVSAPCKEGCCDVTVVKGLNLDDYDPAIHQIISMASCTTNGLAPLVKVLYDQFGISAGLFSTIHAYTNSQTLTDQPMKDEADSWAAGENINPGSSGAANALSLILPATKGIITGKAYRVPVRTGSIVELYAVVEKPNLTVDIVNDAFRYQLSHDSALKEVAAVLEGDWASSRIIGEQKTALVMTSLTQVVGNLVCVAAMYDNEMGYSTRLAEVAAYIAQK